MVLTTFEDLAKDSHWIRGILLSSQVSNEIRAPSCVGYTVYRG